MNSGDFLRKDAHTPFTEHYVMAGVIGAISTNCAAILDAARESFCPTKHSIADPRLRFRFWIDPKGTTQPPWPKPFFQGLRHTVFVGLDTQSSVLIDLRNRRAFGRLSPALGADLAYWKSVIYPVLMSIMSASVGIVELHCGCVAKQGKGILLVGASGSGKSTLALAFAQSDFGYVSDDRTLCSEQEGQLGAWGLPARLKLRPNAKEMFAELRDLEPNLALNGERAILIDPDRSPSIERVRRCEPRCLVFLDRQEGNQFELTPMSPSDAAISLEGELIAESSEAAALQRSMIARLVALPCFRLRYGGPPKWVAEKLAREFELGHPLPVARTCSKGEEANILWKANPARRDPLRRFVSTQHGADLAVMGRTIRVESNSPAILERTQELFAPYDKTGGGSPVFRWTIVSAPHIEIRPPWPEISAFSDEGVRFINIGQRSFIAVDLEAREAVAVLAEELANDPLGYCTPFLFDVFHLTSSSLGLVPLSATCVASGGKGILIFGPPGIGKTTSSYMAKTKGLEFFADLAVFLEFAAGKLCAWGDFLPAIFRPETVQFIPELQGTAHPFHYRDLTFLYQERYPSRQEAHPVTPGCSIFLERFPSSNPTLLPMSRGEFRRRLLGSQPMKDDRRFQAQRAQTLEALEELPSYRLIHDNNPGALAEIYRSLLIDKYPPNTSK